MAALDVVVEREVASVPAAVWEFVVDGFFANHPRWDPAIAELRKLTDGPVAQGTRGLEVRNFGGRQAAEFVVTELEPQRVFSFSNTSGPFALERSYSFAPTSTGCRFIFRFQMRPKGPMVLLFPLVQRTIARQVGENIDRLCALLEANGGRGAPPLRRAN
jgi:hypothetical protein